ncbi:hypothetical protein GCM10009092_20380 [Bowmanella denitrificans]|uniref:Uncharacterized protein n=1 Tax=Bowmanella denitrificans TaxID=366582 RepID=A0ABN0X633_9ALTE
MSVNNTEEFYQQLGRNLSDTMAYIRQHPALILSVLYLLASTCGLMYIHALLAQFEVDGLQHIELADFFLAVIAKPTPMVAWLCISLLVYGFYMLDKRLRGRWSWYCRFSDISSKPFFKFNPLLVFVLMFGFFLYWYAMIVAQADSASIKEGKRPGFKVFTQYAIGYPKEMPTNLILDDVQIIVSTSRYLWLFDKNNQQVLMLPHANVASIMPLSDQPIALLPQSDITH